jgi:hypothetical protein
MASVIPDDVSDSTLAARYRNLFCPQMIEAITTRDRILYKEKGWSEEQGRAFESACENIASLVSLSLAVSQKLDEATTTTEEIPQ